MTIRAFLIGLALVAGLTALDPYTSFNRGYGWMTGGHFPMGAVFLLIVLTVGVNLLLKLIGRRLALSRAELMLVFCMLIVSCGVAGNGLMRYWFPTIAGPSYIARRADIPWRDTALAAAPDGLLVTKRLNSVAVTRFFEGQAEDSRIPYGQWAGPIARWAVYIMAFYMAVLFMCGLLRKQWVDNERLQFPLARIPLEFTEERDSPGLLPRIFSNRSFLAGLITAGVFRFLRAVPLIFGKDAGWGVTLPLKTVLADTPLRFTYFENVPIWWDVIGFAYLVPADVSLSMWLFYVFGRFELQTASWMGSSLHYGGTWSEFMQWQSAGTYIAFAVGAVFMARRHLWAILRKAFGFGRDVDDSQEPVGYGVGFWGFVVSCLVCIAWSVWFGMRVWVAPLLLLLGLCLMFVHARIACQAGIYLTQPLWGAPNVMNGLGYGRVFSRPGAVVAHMQSGIVLNLMLLAPGAMHAFRISEVFRPKRRKLLLPAVTAALLLGIFASGWVALWQGYHDGGVNYSDTWGITGHPRGVFDGAHYKIERPSQVTQIKWAPFSIGLGLTGAVMFMRARFYWWPIHSIGLLNISNWYIDRIWLPFFLGWLVKVCLVKFGTGRMVREARYFFMAFILAEIFVGGISVACRTLSAGNIPGF